MDYLLIDGNNLAIRSAFANSALRTSDGIATGVHYGVIQSLITLKKKYDGYRMLIAWDGKSARRMEESEMARDADIIPGAYKANRKVGPKRPEITEFYEQAPYLQKAIHQLGIAQIRLAPFEADDVLATYSRTLSDDGHHVTLVTSDRDYWQLLRSNVDIWDGGKQLETTEASWKDEYKLDPIKSIDLGALMGDVSDNIFGIPGWGMKTALKEVQKYGTYQGVLKAYAEKHAKHRLKYPDYSDYPHDVRGLEKYSEEERDAIKAILEVKTKSGKRVYPDVTWRFPWAGVLVAFAKGEIKMPKCEIMALVFSSRIDIAFSLKSMDHIPDLPEIEEFDIHLDKVIEYLEYFEIYTLHDSLSLFSDENTIASTFSTEGVSKVTEGVALEPEPTGAMDF